MKSKQTIKNLGVIFIIIIGFLSCKTSKDALKEANKKMPERFGTAQKDSTTIAHINWRDYFGDDYLNSLIDTALKNNQEINIMLQEIVKSQSEVMEKKGDYLPFVGIGIGAGVEKPGRYTRDGTVEKSLKIKDDKDFPEPLGDFKLAAVASWEIDIWGKLRNAKNAAQMRYLAQKEAKNFLVTQIISEIAESYYELTALDNLLEIINKNVKIQSEALEKMRILKENAKANQLAVNRFEAQLLNTTNKQYAIKQKIVETENRIYFLTGSYPSQNINRHSEQLMELKLDSLQAGIPSQLLENRPDIREAEFQIAAAKLDIKSAKANFYPKLDLKAGLGFQAFNLKFLFSPESILFDLAGDLIAPLINRKAIKAQYNRATAQQVQSVYTYQQTLLNAYTDVLNQLAKLNNYSQSFNTKKQEVEVLDKSVDIANNLFQYAKADYIEVLLTQEGVLDAQMELIETKLNQVHSKIQLYRALGGGWTN